MTNDQKKQVKDALVRYVSRYDTQAEAAGTLQNISPSTISLIKNNNWELLSESLWQNVARQVGFYCRPELLKEIPADTSCYLLLRILFGDAQRYTMTHCIAINEGLGKTFAATYYAHTCADTCYMAGLEQYNRKSFMTTLMAAAGLEAHGTVPELIAQFTALLSGRDQPLIIIDDAHKLKDRVLHLVVMLARVLAGKAGIVILGSDRLKARVIEGVRTKRAGYDEILKSIGKRFITLTGMGPNDVQAFCSARGLQDDTVVAQIKEEANNVRQVAEWVDRYTDGMEAAA